MEKKKIVKKALLVVLIIFIAFVLVTIRKMVIISNLNNKLSKYTQNTNYYAKLYSYEGGNIAIVEGYNKENKHLTKYTRVGQDDTRKLIVFSDGEKNNTYIEANEEKVAIPNSQGPAMQIQIVDYLYTENLGQLVMNSVVTSIKSVKCNGRVCYYITGAMSSNILTGENSGVYIDKETGLPVRAYGITTKIDGETIDTITDYNYKFNTVTDENLKEPDIAEYTIKESD